jgi:hypothetical protein
MVRHLFVVSRDHAWLYTDLQERFMGDLDVQVILDRRLGDRRSVPSMLRLHHDRRRGERRRAIPPEDDLRRRSHYIIEL